MLAVSREHDKLFIYQPDDGMAVPVIVDLASGAWEVGFPSAMELENDFSSHEDWAEVLRSLPLEHRQSAELGRQSSAQYTLLLRDQIDSGDLTVASLRLIVRHHRASGPLQPSATAQIIKPQQSGGFNAE